MTATLDTFMDGWGGFNERHPEMADNPLGGMTWGFMRAIAECPECPGVFRVPVNGKDWDVLGCPRCGGVWRWEDPEKAPAKPARKRRR